jgi:polysaccharide export outer membrane protein
MRLGQSVVAGVMLAIVLAMLTGCASDVMKIQPRVTSWEELAKRPPDATYVVDPPDVLSIEFQTDPSLNRSVALRQDGTITVPYLEDVHVAGLTTIQIREKLESLYAKYYQEPRILVSVSGYLSKHVYVYGEVGRQGAVPYTGAMNVSDLIGSVGGLSTRAAWTRLKVIRGDPDNPEVTKVNFRRIMLEGDLSEEVSLSENDVVRVPPTALAWIGYRIDDLLFPFRPALSAVATGQQIGAIGTTAP